MPSPSGGGIRFFHALCAPERMPRHGHAGRARAANGPARRKVCARLPQQQRNVAATPLTATGSRPSVGAELARRPRGSGPKPSIRRGFSSARVSLRFLVLARAASPTSIARSPSHPRRCVAPAPSLSPDRSIRCSRHCRHSRTTRTISGVPTFQLYRTPVDTRPAPRPEPSTAGPTCSTQFPQTPVRSRCPPSPLWPAAWPAPGPPVPRLEGR